MAIKDSSSGSLSMSEIVAEFGGTAPHSLSEYYRTGTLVPDLLANANIPLTGSGSAISFSNFYGARAFASQSFSVPALNDSTWWDRLVFSNNYTTAYSSQGEVWSSNVVDLVLNAEVTISTAVIKVPALSVTMQSEKDSDDYDDDEYTGIREPGIRIRKPDGTVLGDTRTASTVQVFGNETETVTIPAKTFNTTVTGTYKVYFIADVYRSPEGDASLMRWTSNTFNITCETR